MRNLITVAAFTLAFAAFCLSAASYIRAGRTERALQAMPSPKVLTSRERAVLSDAAVRAEQAAPARRPDASPMDQTLQDARERGWTGRSRLFISGDEPNTTYTIMLISALDGQILLSRTEHENGRP